MVNKQPWPRDKGKFTSKKRFDHLVKRQDNIAKIHLNKHQPQDIAYEHSYCKYDDQLPTAHAESPTPSSTDDIPNLVKLKPIDFCRFIIDLKTLKDNFFCKVCGRDLALKNIMGVLPSGVCGHLVIKCVDLTCSKML